MFFLQLFSILARCMLMRQHGIKLYDRDDILQEKLTTTNESWPLIAEVLDSLCAILFTLTVIAFSVVLTVVMVME